MRVESEVRMDNLEDKTERNTDSSGESRQFRPDPIEQARDDSSRPREEMQPTEIIHSAQKPISVADAALLPNQLLGLDQHMQAAPSLVELLVSILRFKWTILAVFVLVAAPAIAVIWTQVVPKYRARAELRVQPIIPFLVFQTENSGMIPLYGSFLNTQVSITRSLTVLQRVLDQQEVQETQWYKKPWKSLVQRLFGNTTAPPIERLRDDLSVNPRRETEIIDVTFMDSSAKDAKLIVDTVLDQYTKYIRERSDATKDKLYRQLVDQHTSLKNEIEGRETVTAGLRKSLGTGTPQELVSSKRVRLDETQASLSKLQQSIAISEWERKELEDLMKQAITDDSNDASAGKMEKQPKYYEDAEWRKLDIDVRTIRHQIANSLLTLKNPDMVRIAKSMEFAEGLLQLREAQLDEQWGDRSSNVAGVQATITGTSGLDYEERLRTLEYQLARSKLEENLLIAETEKQQTGFQSVFESAQLLEKENKALLHKRGLFDTVRQRLDQKKMERNVPGSIEVLSRAFVSSKPYNDRRIVFTAMVLFLGLGMGGGAAFLRASKDQTIYARKDIPHPMQVPFLGYIPVRCTKKSLGDEVNPATIESIRIVRTALLSRLNGQGSTTLLVTSAAAGTGKSTFTMMLGESLAQVGKKVLLIDADFQKITLTKRFDLSNKSGFIESMCCRSIKRHVFRTEISGLSIMPAGKRGDGGAVFEEIANGAFKACIGQLRKYYEIILLDTSPILSGADATILSNQVDGTIMVERELVSHRMNVISALTRLDSAGGRLLGTVFIGSDNHKDYYGYHEHYSGTSES